MGLLRPVDMWLKNNLIMRVPTFWETPKCPFYTLVVSKVAFKTKLSSSLPYHFLSRPLQYILRDSVRDARHALTPNIKYFN